MADWRPCQATTCTLERASSDLAASPPALTAINGRARQSVAGCRCSPGRALMSPGVEISDGSLRITPAGMSHRD